MRKLILSALLGAAFLVTSAQAEIVVRVGPPRVVVERRPVRPGPRHVWTNGYYRWDGRAYAWEPGRWVIPPHERAVWVAPQWRHRHDGYVFIEGHWR